MKKNNLEPLISCICITAYRPASLVKSIISFCQQTYPHKEFIVGYHEEDQETKDILKLLEKVDNLNLKSIKQPLSYTTGRRRNEAVILSSGDLVCMWDDDDLNYVNRIEMQYQEISKAGAAVAANVITRILLYHSQTGKAYVSFPSLWSCSLMCKRSVIMESPCLDQNEFESGYLISKLQNGNSLSFINDNPSLYTFNYHGSNTMDYKTFLTIINRSEPAPTPVAENIHAYFQQEVDIN